MSAQPSPSRMEAFSDGVIAVIITIMVLEFKVPREPGFSGLRTILPQLIVYALSFSFTGVYWINHHQIVDRLHRVDAVVLWANLALLFSLSLLPFFTNYLVDQHLNSFSVAVYASSLFVTGVSFSCLSASIERNVCRARLAAGTQPPGTGTQPHGAAAKSHIDERAQPLKTALSIMLYLVAIPLAFWHPYVALADVGFVTIIWIVPNFGSDRAPNA